MAVSSLFVAASAFAADEKPTLKDGVDAEVKAAIEAAQTANAAASKAGFEWVWAEPQRGMWTGSLQYNSQILDQAVVMANEGKNDEAKTTAAFVQMAAENGLKQAELAKTAGPSF